jgi:hypothetical protein
MLCAPPPVGVPARGWVGGRTLLVAVRRDAAGRELLAWALAKAAAAGDRVVAVHVTTADGPGTDEMRSSAAADSLASVLAAYDGFCNLNKVDFPLGHCRALSSSSPLWYGPSNACSLFFSPSSDQSGAQGLPWTFRQEGFGEGGHLLRRRATHPWGHEELASWVRDNFKLWFIDRSDSFVAME